MTITVIEEVRYHFELSDLPEEEIDSIKKGAREPQGVKDWFCNLEQPCTVAYCTEVSERHVQFNGEP